MQPVPLGGKLIQTSGNVVGKPKQGADAADIYIGIEADARSDRLDLSHPIQHGLIADWDDMEKIWTHLFAQELRTDPTAHNVLFTEAALTPKGDREKMAQIAFEKVGIPGTYVEVDGVLAL